MLKLLRWANSLTLPIH